MLLGLGQKMLNEQIAASTAATSRLAELEGKRFAILIKGTDLRFVATAVGGELKIAQSIDASCDVELVASGFGLLRLARSASLGDLKSVDATLNGDVRIAEGFAELMRLAVPEPEAVLADWVGDITAHAVGQTARGVAAWGVNAGRAFEQNLAEYLQEESPTLVPSALARSFGAEVDRIRDDVDRAQRRMEILERRWRGRGSSD
jgi:ubiquinone biosynthesis protein UbiJ